MGGIEGRSFPLPFAFDYATTAGYPYIWKYSSLVEENNLGSANLGVNCDGSSIGAVIVWVKSGFDIKWLPLLPADDETKSAGNAGALDNKAIKALLSACWCS